MSAYTYTDNIGDKLIISSNGYGGATLISKARDGSTRHTVRPEHDHIPTVASELLLAAGYRELAALVLERAEAEKEMQERRDEIAKKLGYQFGSSHLEDAAPFRRAIDRIIELEDGQAK